MAFFLLAIVFLWVGRKLGWFLSRAVLYAAPAGLAIAVCVAWGAGVAEVVRLLIDYQQPGVILRWVMGYALGAYVAVPNFGLLVESTVPDYARGRHLMVSTLPQCVYIVASIVLAFFMPHA
jgi:hypothetical protein